MKRILSNLDGTVQELEDEVEEFLALSHYLHCESNPNDQGKQIKRQYKLTRVSSEQDKVYYKEVRA